MNVARILYPVKVLGPGERIGIWLCGCHRACPGCSNPELWEPRPEYEIQVSRLVSIIRNIAEKHVVDGFTISGGEPMNQTRQLAQLVDSLRDISPDILVYTGFRIEELEDRDEYTQRVLNGIAVLIDGEYIEGMNDDSTLRGSANQRIHILNNSYSERYTRYLTGNRNRIQNFTTIDGIVSVGIHHPTFSNGE